MKIVYALPKNLGFMISFDPEAQLGVQAPQALLQTFINVPDHLPIQGEQIPLAARVASQAVLGPSGANEPASVRR